jgi:endo-1,4-beta-xylanase
MNTTLTTRKLLVAAPVGLAAIVTTGLLALPGAAFASPGDDDQVVKRDEDTPAITTTLDDDDDDAGTNTGTNTGTNGNTGTNTGGTNTGGTSTGGVPNTCTQPDSQACSSYQVGTHCGLTYEIWTDSSSACMTNTSYGFRASWDQGDGNYLARKGVRPGSTQPVVTYSADYNPNGNSYLAIYGWTQNPLVEYYIVDSWGSWRPPGTQALGTVEVDGGTYDIYRSERVNQPSIEGNKTFWQYWSVRTEKRTSGTITVAPHFAAWASSGLQMGSFYEVSLVIEGYQSSGDADVTVSFR